MKFNLPFINKPAEKKEFYLSLLLEPTKLSAILFEEINNGLAILSQKEEHLVSSLDQTSEEDLIHQIDKVIGKIEESLPSNAQVQKTIFGVPYHWADQGKIKREHLVMLKKVCELLELTPIGFLIPVEAIVHYLQKKEGAPVSGIFIEHARDQVSIFMVRAGNIIETQTSPVHGDFLKTVRNLLSQVTSFEVLPARILLLDYDGAAKAQQEFLAHPWDQELSFLHLPQVVVLGKGFENEAIIHGFASQMGFDLLDKSKGAKLITKQGAELPQAHEPSPDNLPDETGAGAPVPGVEGAAFGATATSAEVATQASEFGFKMEEDVAAPADEPEEEAGDTAHEIPVHHATHYTPTEKIDQNITPVDDNFMPSHPHGGHQPHATHHDQTGHHNRPRSASSMVAPVAAYLSGLSGKFAGMKSGSMPKVRIGHVRKGLVLTPIIAFAFLGLTIYGYYQYLLKAQVVVFLAEKTSNKSHELTLAPEHETNIADMTLKAETITIEQKGSDSRDTTGKKETGNKAKGEVTIYNKTEFKRTLNKGTIIVGPNGLQFELTGDVQIASTSAFSTTISSSKGQVEAVKLGSDYNVGSNSNFTVKDIPSSSVFAKNESAFSGGSKKDLNVVAKKDIDEATKKIAADLEKQAMEQAKSSASAGNVLLPQILSSDITEKTADKKEGEESKKVNVNATIKFTFLSYKKQDLQDMVVKLAEEDNSPGYKFAYDKSSIEVSDFKVDAKDKTAATTMNVKYVYLPNIDTEQLKTEITGKKKSEAESILHKITGIADTQVILTNPWPILPQRMPFNQKNLQFTVKTDA